MTLVSSLNFHVTLTDTSVTGEGPLVVLAPGVVVVNMLVDVDVDADADVDAVVDCAVLVLVDGSAVVVGEVAETVVVVVVSLDVDVLTVELDIVDVVSLVVEFVTGSVRSVNDECSLIYRNTL